MQRAVEAIEAWQHLGNYTSDTGEGTTLLVEIVDHAGLALLIDTLAVQSKEQEIARIQEELTTKPGGSRNLAVLEMRNLKLWIPWGQKGPALWSH